MCYVAMSHDCCKREVLMTCKITLTNLSIAHCTVYIVLTVICCFNTKENRSEHTQVARQNVLSLKFIDVLRQWESKREQLTKVCG